MGKYIDAKKLKRKIKSLKDIYNHPNRVIHGIADAFRQDGRVAMCDDIMGEIESLQQEQSECIYGRTLEEREKSCGFCSALCDARIEQEQPKEDVNKQAIIHAFLHCEKAKKIVSEMYGEKFNNLPYNGDNYLTFAFLKQVELDNRFSELAEILQRYGAMPESKEQSNVDFEEDLEQEVVSYIEKHFHIRYDETLEVGNDPLTTADFTEIARHFAEWGAIHLNAKEK